LEEIHHSDDSVGCRTGNCQGVLSSPADLKHVKGVGG
jgi:hypothetical protein